MDRNEEYHDPDYPGAWPSKNQEPPSLSAEEKSGKIKEIIRREFASELEARESEVSLINQRMTTSRRLLHRLRYALVSAYYNDQKLQISGGHIQDEVAAQTEPRARAEVSSLLREGQRRIHPSLRKLLGKQSVDLDEIFKNREPRNKTRKDYSAMVKTRNYTIVADSTKTLRPEGKEKEPEETPGTSKPKKIPRQFNPKVTNVVSLDEVTRNKMKHRYRIIIGNTSKYVPPASRADRSTHKWLLYVRGSSQAADISPIVTAVTARLHHSYAPHHTVHIDKPPYHISRRGWGEFPAKIELHFALPHMNPAASVEHTIKLDRNYTGMQILGAETVVDVWLYSTSDMLQYEYKDSEDDTKSDDQTVQTDTEETVENNDTQEQDNWMEFFAKGPMEVDVDEMIIKPIKQEIEEKNDVESLIESNIIDKTSIDDIEVKTEPEIGNNGCDAPEFATDIPNEILSKPASVKKRIVKYIDPTTGKIYYLEMDRTLDLSTVQEIVINNTQTAKISPIKANGLKSVRKKRGGVSLLKPEVKSLLKNEVANAINTAVDKNRYSHIENDHCYLGASWAKSVNFSESVLQNSRTVSTISASVASVKKEISAYECLCSVVRRFSCVRSAVFLVKKIPLVNGEARDPDFLKHFPFVVENDDKYWKLDFAKRRNIEWSRAKLINKILTEHYRQPDQIWRTKQILMYLRLHGHYSVRPDTEQKQLETNDWSSWTDLEDSRRIESNIKEMYPNGSDISTLSLFDSNLDRNLSDVVNLSDSDEEVDIVSCDIPLRIKREVKLETSQLVHLPAENDEDRLRFLFIEKKCADIGIDLRNEDVGHGFSYSAVHAVLLSAVRSLAEELVREALAAKLTPSHTPPSVWTGSSSRISINLEHVYRALGSPRLQLLTAKDLATEKKHTTAL